MNRMDYEGKSPLSDTQQVLLLFGVMFASAAYALMFVGGLMDISSQGGSDPYPQLLRVTYALAAAAATIATAFFAVLLSGIVPSSWQGFLSAGQIYSAAAGAVVSVYEVLVRRAGFTIAGVAVGAAFMYNLVLLAALYINEFEESL